MKRKARIEVHRGRLKREKVVRKPNGPVSPYLPLIS